MIYIINFVILSVNSLFERFIKTRFFLTISAIILVLFAGLRNINFIGDSQQYAWDYSIYLNKIGKGQFEAGFSFLEKVCSFLGLSVTGFFIIIALMSMIFLTLGFKNLTIYPTSAILYYYARFFINRDMNQIRAALAASIIVFSLPYLFDKDLLKFIGVIFIASLIHSAAIIALLLYPINYFSENCIWKLKRNKRIILYIVLLTFAFVLSRIDSNFISSFIGRFNETYVSRTSDYGKASYGLANPVIWLQVLISLLSLSINRNSSNNKIKVCLSAYIFSTFLLILFSNFYVLAGRLSTMLATVEPILILNLIDIFVPNKKLSDKVTSYVFFVGISLVIFWLINCYSMQLPAYEISL